MGQQMGQQMGGQQMGQQMGGQIAGQIGGQAGQTGGQMGQIGGQGQMGQMAEQTGRQPGQQQMSGQGMQAGQGQGRMGRRGRGRQGMHPAALHGNEAYYHAMQAQQGAVTTPPPAHIVPYTSAFFDQDLSVRMLNSSTFDVYINQYNKVLVFFFGPWCSKSKAASDVFIETAKAVNTRSAGRNFGNGADLGQLAAVDCFTNAHLCQNLLIMEIPAFLFFQDGGFEAEYSGAHTKEGFMQFLRFPQNDVGAAAIHTTAKPFSDLKHGVHVLGSEGGAEDFDNFIHMGDSVLVMFQAYWDPDSKKAKPEYLKLAKAMEGSGTLSASVDCALNVELCQYFAIAKLPALKLFQNAVADAHKDIIEFVGEYKFQPMKAFVDNPPLVASHQHNDAVTSAPPTVQTYKSKVQQQREPRTYQPRTQQRTTTY